MANTKKRSNEVVSTTPIVVGVIGDYFVKDGYMGKPSVYVTCSTLGTPAGPKIEQTMETVDGQTVTVMVPDPNKPAVPPVIFDLCISGSGSFYDKHSKENLWDAVEDLWGSTASNTQKWQILKQLKTTFTIARKGPEKNAAYVLQLVDVCLEDASLVEDAIETLNI